jgi:hypothetical protein
MLTLDKLKQLVKITEQYLKHQLATLQELLESSLKSSLDCPQLNKLDAGFWCTLSSEAAVLQYVP